MNAEEVLGDLVDSAIGARTHFDMWWAQASEGRSRYFRAMDAHSDFFSSSRDAHFVAFFVYFGQLFDKRADASSIKNYLKLAAVAKKYDAATHGELSACHAALVPRAEPLRKVRNLRIAHVNAKLRERDVFVPLGITWDEIRATIYDSTDLVVRLCGVEHSGEVGIPYAGRLSRATTELLESLAVAEE